MIRLIYNFLWPFGLIIFLPGYLIRMFRRGDYRKNFGQRLGFYSDRVAARLQNIRPLWIHAVSVGEVRIGLKLAHQLRQLRPDLPCVLTTTTTTGYGLAEKSAPPWINPLYSPLDFWPVMRRGFALIDPAIIVLIEGEIWPNLVSEAKRRGTPVVLANARLSRRSEARFQRFGWAMRSLFRQLDLVCVATNEDVGRWRSLGVPAGRIEVVGNIKYDSDEQIDPASRPRSFLNNLGIDRARPIILGGSTHRGEEAIIGDAFLRLREQFPSVFLIIAPRHVERTAEVERSLKHRGLEVARRSQPSALSGEPDILLLDTTGELQDWYHVADAVFIGKSLSAHGGQNPVEAIEAGRPVIFGPHMENFAQLADELVKAEAALRVDNSEQLLEQFRRLLADAALRDRMAERARGVILPHRGATLRTAQLIEEVRRGSRRQS